MDKFYKTDNNDFLSFEELGECIGLDEQELEDLLAVRDIYKMRVTRYYAGLIRKSDAGCPMRKQCIPTAKELAAESNFVEDPLDESGFSPVSFLVHKYKDRVAFMASPCCF